MEDNVTKLYNALKKKNYTDEELGGSEKDFREGMKDPQTRKSFYDWVSNRADFKIGDFDSYEQRLSSDYPSKERIDTMLAQNQQLVEDFNQRIDNMQEYGLGGNTKKGQRQYNGLTGKFEDTYLTPAGNRYTSKSDADNESLQYRKIMGDAERQKNEQGYVEGLIPGIKQGWNSLVEGAKYLAGETANVFTGSSLDDAQALDEISRMEKEGLDLNEGVKPLDEIEKRYYELLNNDTNADNKDVSDEQRFNSQEAIRRDNIHSYIRDVLEESGGDWDKAKQLLAERAADKSWGDEVMQNASAEMNKAKPTKGFGAWVGNLVPQMAPSAAAIALSFITKNPKYAKMVGGIGMGGMTAATAGQSMKEARDAGATNGQTWAVGIADGAIEYATEMIPFDRYTSRLFNGTKKKVASEMAEAVTDASSPAKNELEKLLRKANDKLGGKLFSKENAKKYLTDIAAEGASEFAAEALQTITPMIYQSPEEYPTITEILQNGWEGAKGGLFMGAVLGGASKGAEYYQNRQRRKEQGFVDVAEVQFSDKDTDIAEILGKDVNGNFYAMRDGKVETVTPDQVVQAHHYTFDEFENGRIEIEADEAWDKGYNVSNAPDMQDVKNTYENKKAELAEQMGVETESLDDEIGDPLSFILEQRKLGKSVDELQPIIDYTNAKYAYDGMQQKASDDVESQVTASNSDIDSRTSKTDGMVHPAVMKSDDREVFIVDGHVNMTDDGTMVDVHSSDETILVKDKNTGEVKFASPDEVLDVAQPIDASLQKITEEQRIRNEYQQKFDDDVNGRITQFNAGDPYTLTDNDGNQTVVTLTPDENGFVENPNGTVNFVREGGKDLEQMSKDELQQMFDNTNKKRAADQENERKKKAQNVGVDKSEQNYKSDDEFVFLDDDKNEKKATIKGRKKYDPKNGLVPDDNGNIVEYSVDGEDDVRHSYIDELNGKVVSYNPVAPVASPAVGKIQETPSVSTNVVENNATSEGSGNKNSALQRIPKDEKGNPIYEETDNETAWDAILEQTDGDESIAITVAQGMLADKEAQLKKLEKVKSKGGVTIAEKIASERERKAVVEKARGTVEVWKKIAETGKQRRKAKEAEKQKALHEEAVRQVEAEREVQKLAEAERAAVGNENPMPAISDKWNKANKLDGIHDEIVLPNGEHIKGHYVLHEAGVSSPSHQSGNGFQKTEGFPIDEAGNTVNDRDYEGDTEAQRVTRDIAGNYDQRALQTPVVVSQDGVVLSGNGRTMAGEIAAMNGTDSAYNDYLKQYAAKYGFTPEQVGQMQHPRVAFVPDGAMPYTAETFAKFNQQEMKSQNKTEHAVKLGKTVPDDAFGRILKGISRFETLGDFYNDAESGASAIKELVNAGVIPQAQLAEMVDGGKLSAVGRETLENVLIGKSFEGDPNAVRMLSEVPSMRQSGIFALSEISSNLSLGDGFTLKNELADAIKLCYDARLQGKIPFGDAVSTFARQGNLFASTDEAQTVADYQNAVVMMLADVLNDKRVSRLKKVIATYNKMATDSANGQFDIFTGKLKEREDIINEVLDVLNYETKEKNTAAQHTEVELPEREATATEHSIDEIINAGTSSEAEQVNSNSHEDETVKQTGTGTVETESGNTSSEGSESNTGNSVLSGTQVGDTTGNQEIQNGNAATGEVLHDASPDNSTGTETAGQQGFENAVISEDGPASGQASEVVDLDDVQAVSFNSSLKRFRDNVHDRYDYESQSEIVKKTKKKWEDELSSATTDEERTQADIEIRKALGAQQALQIAYEEAEKVNQKKIERFRKRLGIKEGDRVVVEDYNGNVDHGVVTEFINNHLIQVKSDRTGNEYIYDSTSGYHTSIKREEDFDNTIAETSDSEPKPIVQYGSVFHNNQAGGSAVAEVVGSQMNKGKREYLVRYATSLEDLKENLTLGEKMQSEEELKSELDKGSFTPIPSKEKSVEGSIAVAESETETNPSDAQKVAGNYKKGHVKVDGYDITIENPKGSRRSGKDAEGNDWSVTMNNTYGYIRGTEGVDGDHIDVFLSEHPEEGDVYVVDQLKEDDTFDEHKVMYGFNSQEEAEAAYLSNYSPGWKGLGNVTQVSKEEFKKWINSSHRKTKPFAEYATIVKRREEQVAAAKKIVDDAVGKTLSNADKTIRVVGYDEQGNVKMLVNGKETVSHLGVAAVVISKSKPVETQTEPIVKDGTVFRNMEAAGNAVAEVVGSQMNNGKREYLVQYATSLEDLKGNLILGEKMVSEDELKSMLDNKELVSSDEAQKGHTIAKGNYYYAEGNDTVFKVVSVNGDIIEGLVFDMNNLTKEPFEAELPVSDLMDNLGSDIQDVTGSIVEEAGNLHVGDTFTSENGQFSIDSIDTDNHVVTLDNGSEKADVPYLQFINAMKMGDFKKVEKQKTESKPAIAPRMEGYSIEARKDTRDNSDIYAVKFDERVSRDEFKGQREIAKKFGGYWSNFGKKGFLFKTEEAAQDFAETVMGRTVEEVENDAPIRISDLDTKQPKEKEVVTHSYGDGETFEIHQEHESPETAVFVDKPETWIGRTFFTNGMRLKCTNVDNGYATFDNLDTMMGMGFEVKQVQKYLRNGEWAATKEEPKEQPKEKAKKQTKDNAKAESKTEQKENKRSEEEDPYHTAEERAHYEELKKRMRAKLSQLNAGVDPELLQIGVEMAFFHFQGGMRHFADFCKTMIEDCGDAIRPHLKMLYNAASGTEEFIDKGWDMEMDDRKTVRDFDVYNFDKHGVDAVGTAEHVVAEAESIQQGEQVIEQIKDKRNEEKHNERKQEEANTAALAIEAATTASQARGKIEKATTEEQVEEAEKEVDKQIEKVDEQLAVLNYVDNLHSGSQIVLKDGRVVYATIIMHSGEQISSTQFSKPTVERIYATYKGRDLVDFTPDEIDIEATLKLSEEKESKRLESDVNSVVQLAQEDEEYKELVVGNPDVQAAKEVTGKIIERIVRTNRDIFPELYKKHRNDTDFRQKFADDVQAMLVGEGDVQQEKSPIKRPKGWENLKVGDKVIYKGQECTVHDFMKYGEGEPSLDTGMAPVIYEVAAWDEIKPIEEKTKEKTKAKSSKPKTKKEQLNLFEDLFNQKEENHEQEKVQLQSGSSTTEREGGHESRPNESLGESQQHEVEGTDGRGMGGRDGKHSVSDNNGSGSVSQSHKSKSSVKDETPSAPKNTRNNVAERGTDYAPKGDNARVEANIKAIETMNRLVESGEPATREDMEVMRRFSGWGGLGGAFKEKLGTGAYAPVNHINQKLREILTPEQYEWARSNASMSQYFTPAAVIDKMWDIARALGFKGGNVLEGSAGIGNILGLMPRDLSAKSNIHAVEVDEAIGQMLALLYPDAKVDIQGFEKTKVANGSVDLSITNVPFVTGLKVFDDSGDADLSKKFRDIHNFCIAKNVRKLREGGIGIFISSNGTLDGSPKLMNWITNEGKSDVVGAFRLNSNTFGGTNATSDIIVVRKRVNGQKSTNAIDVSRSGVLRAVSYLASDAKANEKPKDLALTFNQYFIDHPEYMGGEMAFAFEKGETWQETSRRLYPSTEKNQDEMLDNWVKDMQSKDWEASTQQTAPREDTSIIYENLGADVKEGTMLLDKDDNLCIAQRGKAVPLNLNANKVKGQTKAQCFKDYKAIKDTLNAVLDYQASHSEDKGLVPLLKELNRAYDNFVNTYGRLNKNVSVSFLKNDMEFPSIAALENVTERATKDGKKEVSYAKTDVFQHRVVDMETEPKPTNVKDAIIASIYLNGFVNVPYIAEQLGKSEGDVRTEIVQSGLGFENPITTGIEVSYEYLSGNVREKLVQAKEANIDGRYDVNIKALEGVIPMNIPAHLIEFTLGSSWVDPKLYTDYIKEKTDLDVTLVNTGGTWVMKAPYYISTEKNKSMGVRSEICDKIVLGHELIEAALQNKTISVKKVISHSGGETETISDKEATIACADKVDEIRQDFREWARKKMQGDPELGQKIEKVYNEQFNNFVPKEIDDEFVPEHFGGAAKVVNGKPFQLRKHQAKAAIRATTQPLMLAHEVGTGKTYTLITTAMEMRRLGTARKPMIVVQNATVGQFVGSAKALYPNARILTLEDSDKNKEGRKNFYAKIRYNDWDMIVVPQSVFERIPDSPEREARFIENKIEEKIKVLEQLREHSNSSRDPVVKRAEKELEELQNELNDVNLKKKSANNELKDMQREAKAKQNATVKAQEMLDRDTDDTMDFDDMGIDALLIDEAHEYKHLGFETAMQRGVKGVDPSYSKKSQGVYLKTQAVLENNNGRNVVFATGTPISNTAAEIWTFMRYLIPDDVMKDYGIYYFDDFVRNFGQIQQTAEFGASGKYKEVNRFMGYVNLPELVRIWGGVADTVLTREAGGVNDKIPAMEGGKAQDVFLPQTKALRSVMKFVKDALADFEKMTGKEKKENSHIPLVMYGIAKAAAVDARLVVDNAADEPNSKTNETVRQTLRSLEDSKEYHGTVAIFADNYQNKRSGFNLYEDIRDKLIAQGVPENQIVIMKSGMTVKKKLEIFDKVNRGEVRVIMGSTFTLGTGVNIQERLHTLIHVDAPNRPMDYTQRNGRILRQGNLHKEWGIPVRILRFGVEDSLDVTAYQRLKTKGAIADSIMNGKQMIGDSMNNRVLEEEQDIFGDITAQLSGSQYALLKNQIEKQIKKLEGRRSQYEQDQTYIHNQKPRLKGLIAEAEKRRNLSESALKKVESVKDKDIVIGKSHFKNVEEMADFIKDYNSKQHERQEKIRNGVEDHITSNLTISVGGIDFVLTSRTFQNVISTAAGRNVSASTMMHYSCPELGLAEVPVSGQKLKNALNDILDDVMSGNDFREYIESAEKSISSDQNALQQLEAREGKPFGDQEALDKAVEKLDEYEKLMKAELAEKEAKYAEMDKEVEGAKDVSATSEEDDENSYREVSEKQLLSSLREASEKGETVKVYRTMQVIDGELYSPMAKKVAGKETSPIKFRWEKAEENPELAKQGDGSKAMPNKDSFYIVIDKGQGKGSLTVAYNPYTHTSRTVLNDQFSSAFIRPNLVVVEVEVPKSELEGIYHAEKAKDSVGEMNWHSGAVSGLLAEMGNPRKVILTRYDKPVRILTKKEEAQMIAKVLEGTDIAIPYNLVTPQVRVELERLGVEIDENPSGSVGKNADFGKAEYITDEQIEAMNKKLQANAISDPKNVRAAAERLAEELNTPVEIIEDVETITSGNPVQQRRMRNSKGWYNTRTGKVYVVVPNNIDVEDVASTVFHEVVAHKGLRELVGEDNYETFLKEVFDHSKADVRKKISEKAAKHGWDFAKATDEYLGELAEKGFEDFTPGERSIWQKLKDLVMKAIDKFLSTMRLPKSTKLGDNELRYMLWRSHENLRRGKEDVIQLAQDIVKRQQLGLLEDSNIYSNRNVAEEDEIIAKAKKNGTYMKAPNGKSTNLNEKQWVQVRTSAFKKWFGDWENDPESASKVVDENGEPRVVDEVYLNLRESNPLINREKIIAREKDIADRIKALEEKNGDKLYNMAMYNNEALDLIELIANGPRYRESVVNAIMKGVGPVMRVAYRYGNIPESRVSYNFRDSFFENGLSVVGRAADLNTSKGGLYEAFFGGKNSPYNIVVGVDFGYTGSDGEMLLAPAIVVGKVDDISTIVKSATDNNGDFDPTDPDIRFRSNDKPTGDAAREYNKAVRTPNKGGTVKGSHNLGYRLKEAYQDSMLALKKLQEAIVHETGKKVNDFENAYMAENRMSSINNTEKEVYMRDYMHPIFDAVSKLLSDGKSTLDDINNYLMAKHGLERNEYFREKAAREAADKWANDTVKAEMANGKDEDEAKQIAEAGKEAIYDEVIDSLQDADYSGLTELTQLEDEEVNEEFTERSEKIVKNFESTHDVTELWDKINAATNESLKKSYDSGMLSLENYEYIKNMFDYYVPLRGWDNNEAGKEYDYLTNNRMHLSPAVVKMRGRKSKADNVLAYIGFSGESSIIQGNRNKMKQHLLNLVVNHPTDLARASKQWYVLDNATGEWEERYPSFPDDATPEQVNAIVDGFEKKMRELKGIGLARHGRISLSTGMHIKRSEQPEHTVRVMRNGQPMNVYINGNPRAAQAVNGILNPDNVSDTIVHRWAQAVKHFMARNFTSQNPAFVFSNLARDVIWADNAVNIKEDKPYRQQFRKNLKKILLTWKTIPLLKKFENGTLDDGNEFEKYFNEFLMNGGETGFTAINTVEDYKRDINRYVEQAQKGVAVPKKAWRKFWDSVEFINRTVEDISRFATYMTSRQQGRSIERSIWDAKEITVNFNKKGSGEFGARYFNFAYVFFNASIQSITNIAKLAYNNPGKMGKTAGKFVTIGMMLPAYSILASMLMGDDDEDKDAYFDLPKWVRENNMVFYIPFSNKKFITIPLPHELRPFYAIGENALCTLMGKDEPEDALKSSIMSFTSLLPLDLTGHDGNQLLNLTPTAALPFAEIVGNKDFFGKPIYKDSPFNQLKPEWQRAYAGTNPYLINGMKVLNSIGGGNNVDKGYWLTDINPAKIEHLFEGYLGGMGKFINKTANFVSMAWDEDSRMMRNVPVVGSFVQDADPRFAGSSANNTYYSHKDELQEMQHKISGYQKEMQMAHAKKNEAEYKKYESYLKDFYKQNAKRFGLLKSYINQIDGLRGVKEFVSKEKQKEIDSMISSLQRELDQKLGRMEKGSKMMQDNR